MKIIAPTDYVLSLIETLTKKTLDEFFKEVHDKFYPEIDISFMNHFLELTNHRNEFIVEHSKLYDYGIMVSKQSSDVKKKLIANGLEKDKDYELRDVSELRLQGGIAYKKIYILTPRAFKICLMRAQRRPNQEADPVKYCDYFILLEEMYELFTAYERGYNEKLHSIKDGKLDKITQQLTIANNKIDALMVYAEDMNERMDIFFDFMIGFARMTIPMWNGASVFKTQLDNLTQSNTIIKALNLLKVMFVVAFYTPTQEPYNVFAYKDNIYTARTNLRLYFCCCNFGGVAKRVAELNKRHSYDMYMLEPIVIGLMSSEINTEREVLKKMHIFPKKASTEYNSNTKSFDIDIHQQTYTGINNVYARIMVNAINETFQEYQMRMIDASDDVNQDIIEHLTNADDAFYTDIRPYCQTYLDCYYRAAFDDDDEFIEYVYCKSSTTMVARPDYGNRKLTDLHYSLFKIKDILDEDRGTREIDNMVRTGIISKKNIKSLKKVAEIEKIDISNVQFPDNLEDDL